MHTYTRGCTRTRARAVKEKIWSEGENGEWDWRETRVKHMCLARKYRSAQRFAPCKTDFEKSTTVLQPKRSIDKIQWFERNFILSTFHWNGTMEYEKVYELFSVAFLPTIAWGWVSNTLREKGTVKPTPTSSVHFKTKMVARDGRCSVSTILRENRELWTV